MRRFWKRLTGLGRRARLEGEMEREMASHLALLEEEFARRGYSPAEARRAAQREYGGLEQAKELHREARTFAWVEQLWRDARNGARSLGRTPLFTAVAVLTLALGIGANTALFSVVNAVLLRPLDYRDSKRLVTVLHGSGGGPVAPANYYDWKAQTRSYEGLEAAEYWSPNLADGEGAEQILGLHMTPGLLPLLGVEPQLGRYLGGEGEREVVLTHRLWMRRFSGDPAVLGRTLRLNGEGYTVVGVMPAGFRFAPFWATKAELYAPLDLRPKAASRGGNSLRLFGRLKAGVTVEAARAEMQALTARLEKEFPGTNRAVRVTPLKEKVVGKVETPLLLLLGSCGLVLLIACANVAHMLLARTAARQREIAVRTALGAGRRRLLGQFLTENLVLALLGAGAGLGVAALGIRALVALSPASLPRLETVRIDERVGLFLLATTVLTALVFGVVPALRSAAGNLSEELKEGGRGGSEGARRIGLRQALVVSEFALAFLLLAGAALLTRSFARLQSIDNGFQADHLLTFVVSVAGTAEEPGERRAAFYRALIERIAALPGVRSASGVNHIPVGGDQWGWNFEIQGRPKPRPGEAPGAVYRLAMPGYLETMGIRVLRGRGIRAEDHERAPGAVVISQSAAAQYWPGRDPLGQRISFNADAPEPQWYTVVGVAADARQIDYTGEPEPELYVSALQNQEFLGLAKSRTSYITVVARTSGDPAALAGAAKQAVWEMDRALPVSAVRTMETVVGEATAQARFEMLLFAWFAVVALVLAAAGIYAVMSHAVSRRTREIGIRMSLGATRGAVVRMVALQALRQAALGTGLGLAGAMALGRLLAGMLYEVKPADPLVLTGVSVLLVGTALAAGAVPARRATRIEATVALRTE